MEQAKSFPKYSKAALLLNAAARSLSPHNHSLPLNGNTDRCPSPALWVPV